MNCKKGKDLKKKKKKKKKSHLPKKQDFHRIQSLHRGSLAHLLLVVWITETHIYPVALNTLTVFVTQVCTKHSKPIAR